MRPSAGLASGFVFLEGNACTSAVATTVPSNNKAFFLQRLRGNQSIKLECRPVTGSRCFANHRSGILAIFKYRYRYHVNSLRNYLAIFVNLSNVIITRFRYFHLYIYNIHL